MTYEHKKNTGSIFKNTYKEEGDNKPEYKGKINVGGTLYDIALWVRRSDDKPPYFSAKISEPYNHVGGTDFKKSEPQAPAEQDDLPF